MGDDAEAKKARGRMSRSLGWALAAFGILLAAGGAASSFDEVFMNDAVPLAFLGKVLGVAAYMFGAHRVGATAAVFSVAALIFLVGGARECSPAWSGRTATYPRTSRTPRGPAGLTRDPPTPRAVSSTNQPVSAKTSSQHPLTA
jgi:hypothetical protein